MLRRPSKVQETVDTGVNFTPGKYFSVDTDKAGAVKAAFKVCLVASPLGLFAKVTS